MNRYIFIPNERGNQIRQEDNVCGNLIELADTNVIHGDIPVFTSKDGYIEKGSILSQIPSPPTFETSYIDNRADAYRNNGLDERKLIVALWEAQVENRPEALNEIQAKRLAIKEQFPK
jgi:hypothetical protein